MNKNTPDKLRNIAIIAHVDHGKTTLVDKLLKQSGSVEAKSMQQERIMDSNDLERERGITILAKNTAINWRDHRINIVDTPGHADFGGEVERILSMVDSVLLLVDALDGPMPQTRFVTQKAFAQNLKPIVVINKIDRDGARPDWVIDQVFDLFVNLGATDEQLDFSIIYASALRGYAVRNLKDPYEDMTPLLECILENVKPPKVSIDGPLQMQISSLDYSSYLGVIGIGRISRGILQANSPISIVDHEGTIRFGKISKVYGYLGLDRKEIPIAYAGDIVAVAGETLAISDTICAKDEPCGLKPLSVDEPTMSMIFQVNDSPFAGREGKFVTSRQIRERLFRESLHNIALRVEETTDPDKFKVSGRGELHLGILIETMRREGFELAVSKPTVIIKEQDGIKQEPYEKLVVDIMEEHQGSIMKILGERKGKLENMLPDGKGRIRLDYSISSRGLFGLHSEFLTLTSGSGLMSHVFDGYDIMQTDAVIERHNGVLVSNAAGVASEYSLWNLQPRGKLFISGQTAVYEGMIVGIHSRDNDLVVNVTKEKKLTNVRASGSDENIILTPPINITLEYAIEFINNDELIEITPKSIRLRKKLLKEHERKRSEKV